MLIFILLVLVIDKCQSNPPQPQPVQSTIVNNILKWIAKAFFLEGQIVHEVNNAVAVRVKGKSFYELHCSGGLIRPMWFVSIRKCLKPLKTIMYKVRVYAGGDFYFSPSHQYVNLIQILLDPNHLSYQGMDDGFDLAMGKLSQPFNNELIKPIPIDIDEVIMKDISTAHVITWGNTPYRLQTYFEKYFSLSALFLKNIQVLQAHNLPETRNRNYFTMKVYNQFDVTMRGSPLFVNNRFVGVYVAHCPHPAFRRFFRGKKTMEYEYFTTGFKSIQFLIEFNKIVPWQNPVNNQQLL